VVDTLTGIGFGDLAFYYLWKQESFVFSKRPDGFLGFSQSNQLVHVSVLLALTVHFTPPYIKHKGTVHPATGHEGPEGNIEIAVLFL
jgi:hypothetical protein